MSTEVRRSFDFAGFTKSFDIVEDCATAVQKLLAEEKISQITSHAAKLLACKDKPES